MIPGWVKSVFVILAFILVIGAAVFAVYTFTGNTPLPTASPPLSRPNMDITKVAEFTPTWGPEDVENLVATAIPTPYAMISEPEIVAMNKALSDKKVLLATDLLFGAEYKAMNTEWYCTNLKLGDWALPTSSIGAAKFVEGQWRLGSRLSDLTFTMEKGTTTIPVYHSADANGKPYTETKYNGVLTITVRVIGVDGPTYLQGNEWIFAVGDPIPGYKLWLIPREILTGRDIIGEKQNMVTNMAQKRVAIETIVPDGSDINLRAMYDTYIASLSAPGKDHIYDTMIAIFEPLARENGFAGIEKVVVKMPPVPSSIYAWRDMNGMPLIPTDYPAIFQDSTCPKDKPTSEDIEKIKAESK